MEKDELLHKEIDLIQGCINRMANNSFLLKGWTISLISIILALSTKEINIILVGLTVLIIITAFWYLDTYFLRIERMYRKLYEWVLKTRKDNKEDERYNLNPHRFEKNVDNILKTMFSETLLTFYGTLFFITIIYLIVSYNFYKVQETQKNPMIIYIEIKK